MAHALEEAWAVLKYDYEDDIYGDDDADELMTLGRDEEEEPVESTWTDEDLDERSAKHGRDYSHLDPNEAGWHREMDRRARQLPEMMLNYLGELFDRRYQASQANQTEAVQDVDSFAQWERHGGLDRVGERLGQSKDHVGASDDRRAAVAEAVERLGDQYDPEKKAADMGFDIDESPVKEDEVEEEVPKRKMSLDEEMLQSGPTGVATTRRYISGGGIREDRGYGTQQVRVKPSARSAWLGGADRAARSGKSGRIIVGDKQSEADLSRDDRLAYINAHKKYAKLHEQRANSEGAWAYQRPDTHPDFEAELPPPGSVVVRNQPETFGGQPNPQSENVVIPASTYRKPHPALREGEEEE